MLQRSAVEARAVVIETLPDDFAATNDNAAMAVMQRRLGGLLQTQGQVIIGLHVVVS